MTARPWLSVVVPTYRGESYVGAALTSIERELAGAPADVEVIVVDDGSDDETTAVVAAYADRLPLVTLPPRRRGSWVAAVNDGLAVARAPWSCMLHQDDRWLDGRLAALEPALRRADAAGAQLVVHGVQMETDDGRAVGRWRPPFRPGLIERERAFPSLLVQNWVSVPGATFRTDAARDRRLDEALWYTADWDLWLTLAARGGLVVVAGTWARFRLHPDSQTVAGSADERDFRDQLEVVHARHGAAATRPVATAARLSIETNVLLAAMAHRGRRDLRRWARSAAVSPAVWATFIKHSRILERSTSRVRAGLVGRRSR